MAGGKQTPRQRMINLMYLVFIAMLAMQMDKKVLSSFGFMKEKIEESHKITSKNNDAALQNLATKASEQTDKFGKLNERALEIHTLSNDLYDYLGSLKDKIYEGTTEEERKNYEAQSSADKVDRLFFEGDKNTPEGQKFIDGINYYRTKLLEILDNEELQKKLGNKVDKIKTNVAKRFNTDDEKLEGGGRQEWIRSRYEGMPLITSVSNISQIRADIKATESEIYTDLVGGQLEIDSSMKNYTGVVNLDKNAFYPGEKVTGSVVLGRYDATLKPTKVELNGDKNYQNFKDGRVVIDMPAGSVGDKTIKGTIFFTEKGEEVPVKFESTYSVIPMPNDAVISADKMNVVYKGLSNPLTISIPGVSGNKVTATAPGLRRVKGDSYVMMPRGKGLVTIKVNGKLPGGKPITRIKKFRIKDIPPAVGMIRNQYGTVPMPKSSLGKIRVDAGLPDFLFDLKLNVSGFSVKVPGQVAIPVKGTRMSNRAKKAIARARRGDIVTIFDIKASVSGSNYKIKKVLNVSVKITN